MERDIPKCPEKIIAMIVKCFYTKPEKMSVYSTLCGLIHQKNERFCNTLIENFVSKLQSFIDDYEFQDTSCMLLAYFDMANVGIIDSSTVYTTLEDMIGVASDHITDSHSQPYVDWIVTTILQSLPLIGSLLEGRRGMNQKIDDILSNVGEIIRKRGKLHAKALRVWSKAEPLLQEEYIDLAWKQVNTLRKISWKTDIISRPYLEFPELSECQSYQAKRIKFPPFRDASDFTPPKVVFRMFDQSDCKQFPTSGSILPSVDNIARSYLEDTLEKIIIKNQTSTKECARLLVDLTSNTKYAMDYIIIEVIFGQMLRLPSPPCPLILYGSLISELCNIDPDIFPIIVAQAISILFERLNSMNVICLQRFCFWFSFHLSNVKCKWSWEKWEEALMGKDGPQKWFLQELVRKLAMLYYPSYLENELPVTYHSHLLKNTDCIFRFSAGSDSIHYPIAGHELVKSLVEMIRSDNSCQEIYDLVQNNTQDVNEYVTSLDDEDSPKKALQVDCIIQTLLKGGAKTISHTESIFSKYFELVKKIIDSSSSEVLCLRSLHDFWDKNFIRLKTFVSMFVGMHIVEPVSVVNWILHDSMKEEFMKFYVWEILEELFSHIIFEKTKWKKEIGILSEQIDRSESQISDNKPENSIKSIDVDSIITQLETAQKQLESIISIQKSTYLSIIQRIIILLTTHVREQNREKQNVVNQWFVWVLQRLQQILVTHHSQLAPYVSTLENLIFTEDVEEHILEVFKRWKSICG